MVNYLHDDYHQFVAVVVLSQDEQPKAHLRSQRAQAVRRRVICYFHLADFCLKCTEFMGNAGTRSHSTSGYRRIPMS